MRGRRRNILISVFALGLGGILYVLLRRNTYIAEFFTIVPGISILQEKLERISCDFLRYYFPDFLWGLSLACGLQAIAYPKKKDMMAVGIIAILCGFLWEVLQYVGLVRGTGDIIDCISYQVAGTLSILYNIWRERNEEDE